jgi:superfamily II DNA or RNA helicase
LGISNPQKIESTTRIEEIQNAIIKSKKSNKPLVIFSTYHSVDRVSVAAKESNTKVRLYVYDEAQYCVTSGDFKETPYFPSDHKLFFTATEKYTDSSDGIGMNNESKFGKIIFSRKPKQLIEKGEMASVAIHLVGSREEVDSDNYESKARIVIESFEKHREVVKQHSASPDLIGPKMLVICDKQDSLKGIMRSALLKKYREENNTTKIYALSSDYGITISGYTDPRVTNKGKEYLFNELNNLEDTDEMILFHVDMVAEGMDVPGITGVLPFRNLGKIKFLQNLGRGTRLCDLDRKKLYSGEIAPKEWNKYVKPYCWVVLPVLSGEYYDFKRRCENYIYALRSDYEFDTSELVVVDNVKGAVEEEPISDITGSVIKKFRTGKDIISVVIQEIEESEAMTAFMDQAFEFKKLTENQQKQLIRDIFGL